MTMMEQMESLDGVQEPRVAEANSDTKLRILDVTTGTDKNGRPYVLPRFEIVGDDLAKDFTKFLTVPTKELAEEDKKKFERCRWAMKEFMEAFGIDPARPGSEEDWVGYEGWAILGIQTSDEYGEQNYIKKFVTPR